MKFFVNVLVLILINELHFAYDLVGYVHFEIVLGLELELELLTSKEQNKKLQPRGRRMYCRSCSDSDSHLLSQSNSKSCQSKSIFQKIVKDIEQKHSKLFKCALNKMTVHEQERKAEILIVILELLLDLISKKNTNYL